MCSWLMSCAFRNFHDKALFSRWVSSFPVLAVLWFTLFFSQFARRRPITEMTQVLLWLWRSCGVASWTRDICQKNQNHGQSGSYTVQNKNCPARHICFTVLLSWKAPGGSIFISDNDWLWCGGCSLTKNEDFIIYY